MNIAADVALCRACGTRSRINELREGGDDDADCKTLSGLVPKHLKVVRDPNDPSGRVELRYWRFNSIVLFLIPFVCVWGGLSLGVIYGSQIMERQFDLQRSLFGIPFLIGTLVIVGIILNVLFARRRLVLEYGRGWYSSTVFGIGFARSFELNRETVISIDRPAAWLKGQGGNHVIAVRNGNRGEKVCASWDELARDYALAMIKRYRT